jgi:hypothetical protein
MRSLELSLFADYFQIYIQDESASGDLSESWNDEATARLLAVAPGAIGIGTVRNMDVPVVVEIHDQEPANGLSDCDHVVEAELKVSSGRIVAAGCTDYFPDARRVELSPGNYRVRVSYGALGSVSEDGLSGEDHYRVQLWLGPPTPVRVLKQRSAFACPGRHLIPVSRLSWR